MSGVDVRKVRLGVERHVVVEPPYDAGTPERAGAVTAEHLGAMYAAVLDPPAVP